MSTFHEKHRPRTLDKIIGHEKIVSRLKGIIKKEAFPSAMLFSGPTSAGKTTLAQCFAAEVNGKSEGHSDYLELNAGAAGKIEQMRDLLEVAVLQPQRGKRRFIVIEEAQQLTGAAEQAILRPLEKAPKKTTFILCSMEPEKLHRALQNRCTQFVLVSHPKENIVRFLKRIAKKEGMDYVNDKMLDKIANNSNGEMRTAANILEALYQAADTDTKITLDDVEEVINSTTSQDDKIAVRIMAGVYAKKFSVVQRSILDASEGFALINKLLWLNGFMLNNHVLKGEKHSKVWWSKNNQALLDYVNDLVKQKVLEEKELLHTFALSQTYLVRLRQQASSFLVPEINLIGGVLYDLIRELKGVKNGS